MDPVPLKKKRFSKFHSDTGGYTTSKSWRILPSSGASLESNAAALTVHEGLKHLNLIFTFNTLNNKSYIIFFKKNLASSV